jgi:signal transduction histidine kinase
VLNHLIGNALEHTPDGGAIRVTAHHCAAGVEIAIADTGCGISPATARHLPALLAGESRPHRGIGLAGNRQRLSMLMAERLR